MQGRSLYSISGSILEKDINTHNLYPKAVNQLVKSLAQGNTGTKDVLGVYIRKHPLWNEEQIELAKLSAQGNADAKEILEIYNQKYRLCDDATEILEVNGINL